MHQAERVVTHCLKLVSMVGEEDRPEMSKECLEQLEDEVAEGGGEQGRTGVAAVAPAVQEQGGG